MFTRCIHYLTCGYEIKRFVHEPVINLFDRWYTAESAENSMVDRKGSECIVRELAVTANLVTRCY